MFDEEIAFDFGFTAADEEEIFAPMAEEQQKKVVASAQKDIDKLQKKLDKLYSAVQPLLKNLKANPEKSYIHWPNRVDKVNEFEKLLKSIYNEKI